MEKGNFSDSLVTFLLDAPINDALLWTIQFSDLASYDYLEKATSRQLFNFESFAID